MKVGIIVAYFGTLPSYFSLFLESCRVNPNFDWVIFTDDTKKYEYPPNVHKIHMSFSQCKELVQSQFDFPIVLGSPKKLCDYKCAYGYVFQKYLGEYDWWGHCDLDQIFGDLTKFITDEMLNKYDKIGSLGHLTLYRNESANNQMFKKKVGGYERYKEVFSSERGFAFDEWLPGNINEIFLNSGRAITLDNFGADINPYRTTFQLTQYDLQRRHYVLDPIKNSIFLWKSGKLMQVYCNNGGIHKCEFPYVHLQKRQMKDKRRMSGANDFYIVPNQFLDVTCSPQTVLRKNRIFKVLNYQYFIVKFQNFVYRLKNGDWNMENVFKK